ncbi:MoaD/ThiS family protein [Candidatus Thorarchaeota archaeon]|nr:MAG: MoaD/ThiS family protein [Candidatus Thorarchaeota archaeon]
MHELAIGVTESFSGIKYQKIVLQETKTVSQLLEELELSTDHVVLINGKRVDSDFVIDTSDSVVVLPLIKGG